MFGQEVRHFYNWFVISCHYSYLKILKIHIHNFFKLLTKFVKNTKLFELLSS